MPLSRHPDCNRIEQEELDGRRQHTVKSQDQPVPIGCRRLESLLELIERLRRQVARKLGWPVLEIEVISCYEAGYVGFWLHHLLEAHGVQNHVLDPASLLVNRRAKPAKIVGIDVDRMQRALGRICAANRMPAV